MFLRDYAVKYQFSLFTLFVTTKVFAFDKVICKLLAHLQQLAKVSIENTYNGTIISRQQTFIISDRSH